MDETRKDGAEEQHPGRRTVIKGAAAGIAGVWALPVVTSFTSPAYAGDSVGNPNPECRGANCATFIPCSSDNPDCVCTTTFTGGGFCVPGSTSCAVTGNCEADGSCPPGNICVVDTCCGVPVCVPTDLNALCPPASGAAASGSRTSSGPGTIGG